jgi:hypothetical protein
LSHLKNTNAIDLAHSEMLAQRALRGADICAEYLGQLVKTASYLEGKLNATKNKASLEYKPATGKATADLRRQAGESAPEVEELIARVSRAKGAKVMIEQKLNILIKAHHQYKELAAGMKKGILTPMNTTTNVVEGYE